MKIIILGAGQVGSGLAASLVREHNDITVVDSDGHRLRDLQDRIDIRGVHGHAAHPQTLMRAGIEDADMIVAVTSGDEINMIACQVAYSLFHTPLRIARVRAAEYLSSPQLFERHNIPVDQLISPEQLVTDHIHHLIEYPGALQVLDFADGVAQMMAMRAEPEGPLVGHELKTLRERMPAQMDVRVVAIFRGERAIIPKGDTVIQREDIVYFLAARKDIRRVMVELRNSEAPAKRIMLAGGGNIGSRLARKLRHDYHVKIIERDPQRAQDAAESLESAIVLNGDCADEELLRDEGIDRIDVYCALTNDDEANILSSMVAKRLGAGKVVTIINRPVYADLVEGQHIDVAISPRQITIGALLARIRRGNVARVHSLRRGAAEAIEAIATGDAGNSKVVGRRIDEIELPPGATIGGIVRGQQVLMAHHDTMIESDDHIILLVTDKRHINQVERLFEVSATFI
ncbi:MAG: Trk system potassium transporter TrkA [Xanthomonadales bacterium]|jgi:trk system potassium uptake protein TrkA|nr:Trk system potassium transporter TrkA [Xanthomonadales bacterium]